MTQTEPRHSTREHNAKAADEDEEERPGKKEKTRRHTIGKRREEDKSDHEPQSDRDQGIAFPGLFLAQQE
mgnify:CR=1 FL=1